ncbi:hypothetical protein NPIL_244931 [Nephila pilipes]|uniref:Uncharacterized protein n=1 Tax=Nephila pilipes TaxID=299642 RepID=A0A8X6MP03_NEPPI|nr:hypothetical protein NPIL_244931 [Nephila pilipes]
MPEESPVGSTTLLTTPDSEPKSGPTNQEPPTRTQPLCKSSPMPLTLQEVVVPAVVEADPVTGLPIGYRGLGLSGHYGGIVHDGTYRGLGYDLRYRNYDLDNLRYRGVLGYTGLLGGYGGVVNYGTPLLGGAVAGYDSRFANLA